MDPAPLRGEREGFCGGASTHLYARRDAVDDLDGTAVRVSRQRLADAVDLHLAFGLRARLLAIDCLTRGALQTAVLGGGGQLMRLRDSVNGGERPRLKL